MHRRDCTTCRHVHLLDSPVGSPALEVPSTTLARASLTSSSPEGRRAADRRAASSDRQLVDETDSGPRCEICGERWSDCAFASRKSSGTHRAPATPKRCVCQLKLQPEDLLIRPTRCRCVALWSSQPGSSAIEQGLPGWYTSEPPIPSKFAAEMSAERPKSTVSSSSA